MEYKLMSIFYLFLYTLKLALSSRNHHDEVLCFAFKTSRYVFSKRCVRLLINEEGITILGGRLTSVPVAIKLQENMVFSYKNIQRFSNFDQKQHCLSAYNDR